MQLQSDNLNRQLPGQHLSPLKQLPLFCLVLLAACCLLLAACCLLLAARCALWFELLTKYSGPTSVAIGWMDCRLIET